MESIPKKYWNREHHTMFWTKLQKESKKIGQNTFAIPSEPSEQIVRLITACSDSV